MGLLSEAIPTNANSCSGELEMGGVWTSPQDLAATGIIEAGDFRIDTAERTATLQGKELQLTSQEFDVLVFLTAHPQRSTTPHTMLATSWTSGLHQTEFLRALMSLRKKLDAVAAGIQYLRTDPWVIYRFAPSSSSAA
jgi:DNA-binding response OmpR family regulator